MKRLHVLFGVAAWGAASTGSLATTSTMTATNLSPANGTTNVCADTLLRMTFDMPIVLTNFGKIRIYNVTNSTTPVDTIDVSLGKVQSRTIAGESFNTYPVLVSSNAATIFPHAAVLAYNQTYFVTVDPGVFADTNKATYAGLTNTNAWRFTTKAFAPAIKTNLVVAADGSGNFCTVQGAVDFLSVNNTNYTLINIHDGAYTEIVDIKSKHNITLRGQSRTGTVVQYANNASITSGGNTHFRMSFKVNANDIAIENLTLLNNTPKGGSQAEALMLETGIKRFILFNAEVDSYQDTVLANTTSTQGYFQNSLVQGDVDYVWGGGNLFFTNCEIRTVTAGGNITQPRTDAGLNGMSFLNCMVTRISNGVVNCTLGRAIGFANGNAAFINCRIDSHIVGWTSGDVATSRYWEYGNSNLTATASVTYNGTHLTNGDVRLINASSATNWLAGWSPRLAPNITNQPVSQVVTAGQVAAFMVGATGIPDPKYQWLKGGTNLFGATSATLAITNAQIGDAGAYSVVVSNPAGVVINTNATLIVASAGTPPATSFTSAPTNGIDPLVVTFMDTSTGSPPLTLAWDFGDTTTTNTAGGASVTHSYAAGTYTVTLTVSNLFGTSSMTQSNLIAVITAFQGWQIQYFGCMNCPQADAAADPDGDGQSNLAEFLAATDPTDSASLFRITGITRSNDDVVISWTTGVGKTYSLQATAGDENEGFDTNGFATIFIATNTVDVTTNYLDVGAAANTPERYYRVRLLP